MQVIGFKSNHFSVADVFVEEDVGDDVYDWDIDECVYDSISGKCYPTLFDLQEAFWASRDYNRDSNPPSTAPYIPYQFSELLPTFEPYEVPLIGIHYHLAPIKLGDNFQAPIINMLEFG